MQPIDWASELDRQREPLRRLARALLGDAHAADDVVQDAFAAVLARERRPAGVASWLRAVVRKLALDRKRRGARRDARESSAARRESVDDGDSLAQLELVEALAREVRELDEPYRAALRLRYFEGRSPREIARTLDVPLATVESRLVRALERLRERLDRRGGREKWLGAAIAWVHPMRVPWMELALVKTVTKIGVAAAALALAWWTWSAWSSGSESPARDTNASAELESPAPDALAAAEVDGARTAVATPLAEPPATQSSPPPLAGIVVDAEGRPLAGVELALLADGESELRATPRVQSGADGRFEFPEPGTAGALRAADERWFTLGSPPVGPRALPCDRVVCVAPRVPLVGFVVDARGDPIEGAQVDLALFAGSLSLPLPASDLLPFSRSTRSRADGTYRIDDAPLARAIAVRARRAGRPGNFYRGLEDVRTDAGRIVLAWDQPCALSIEGRVVDEHDRPLAGAWIDAGPGGYRLAPDTPGVVQLRSDANGEFALPIRTDQTVMRVTVAAPGRRAASFDPAGDPRERTSWPSPWVIRLTEPALTLRGHVFDEAHRPLADAWVDLIDGERFGFAQPADDFLTPFGEYTWEALLAGRGPSAHVAVGADGSFAIGELAERDYRVLAFDEKSLHWTLSKPTRAGTEGLELVIDTSKRRPRVAGRVVDSAGAPVANADVSLGATIPWTAASHGGEMCGTGMSAAVKTDALGRFEFRDVSPAASYVTARPPSRSLFDGYGFLSRVEDVEQVEIELPRVAFVQVELADGAFPPEKVPTDVLAVDGRENWLTTELAGLSIRSDFERGSRTSVFPVGDTARFLVLRRYGDLVERIPVELEAGKINVIRR